MNYLRKIQETTIVVKNAKEKQALNDAAAKSGLWWTRIPCCNEYVEAALEKEGFVIRQSDDIDNYDTWVIWNLVQSEAYDSGPQRRGAY